MSMIWPIALVVFSNNFAKYAQFFCHVVTLFSFSLFITSRTIKIESIIAYLVSVPQEFPDFFS